MEGRKLVLHPVIHTTYGEFKKLYPQGQLLKKEASGEHGSRYQSYFDDQEKLGIFGRANNFRKLPGKDRIVGLRLKDFDVAIALTYLEKHNYALINNISPPVIVTYDPPGQTVSVFFVPTDGEDTRMKLSVSDGKIKQAGKNIVWYGRTGRIIKGSADDLKAIPVITAYWFAWVSFFPNTKLIH